MPMHPDLEKSPAGWEKTRQMGRTNYIWTFGVGFWGIFTGVFWAVAMSMLNGFHHLPTLLTLALVIFPCAGYFFGSVTWRLAESRRVPCRQ
jgi:hypothetical protein